MQHYRGNFHLNGKTQVFIGVLNVESMLRDSEVSFKLLSYFQNHSCSQMPRQR